MTETISPAASIPSAQLTPSGAVRFHLVPLLPSNTFEELEARELDGGVDAEFRVFLDAQLENTDRFVDLAPGAGFVLFSAATHDARPQVSVGVDDPMCRAAIQRNALANDVVVDVRRVRDTIDAMTSGRVWKTEDADGRLFVHVSATDIRSSAVDAGALVAARGLTAVLVDADADGSAQQWTELCTMLERVELEPHVLADSPTGPVVVRVCATTAPGAIIAIPAPCAPTQHDRSASPSNVRTAFNFIAPFCRSGYGITGANLLRSLVDLQADVAFFPLGGVDPSVVDVPELPALMGRQDDFDDRAPSVRLAQQFDLALHVGRGPRISFPIFEIDQFTPRERHHLRHQDRLLVCSSWARTVLHDNGIDVPVSIVPLGVDRRIFHERVIPVSSSPDTVFVQVGKIEARKGQLDLLRAFESAFRPSDKVRLRLYCHNPFIGNRDVQALLAPFRQSPMAKRIELITTPLATQHDVARAMMAADCGVFCSRAEGWNLEALEMLSLGKPVIATAYSAHTEFLTSANAYLVPVTAKEARGAGSWGAFGEPELEALVSHLRSVHEQRRTRLLDQNSAGISTAKQFSWAHSAERLLAAVREVAAT